jgi:phage shock protein E
MKFIKLLAFAVLFTLGPFGIAGLCAENTLAKPLLIDVRTGPEWNEGHLEGAILIPYDKIEEGIAKSAPDKKTKIQLYCRSGRRSGIAMNVLKKLGYEDVSNYGSVKDASEKLQIPVVK